MFVVGVTGGIGSGKSAVTDHFEQLGVDVIDADLASRIVVEPGKPALQHIVEHFGNGILLADGTLDRASLRQCIFNNKAHKQWLEALLHPLIDKEINNEIKSAQSPYVIVVSPLLIETQQYTRCDRILVIDIPEKLQVQRTIARDNNDESQVHRIIASQASRQQRLEMADDILENTAGLQELKQHVNMLHQKYLAIALQKTAKQ